MSQLWHHNYIMMSEDQGSKRWCNFPPFGTKNKKSVTPWQMFTTPTGVVTPLSVNQFVSSSGPSTNMQLDAALAMAGLSKEQAEEIFLLTCKAQKLGRKLVCNFIHLSNKEALFHMGIQATGYEKVTSGCPDHVTTYYMMIWSEGEDTEAEKLDEAIDCLCKEAGEAWLDINSILFCHTLEYQNKLSNFLKDSKDAIEVLHDCIWTVVVVKVMEDAGKPAANGLGITMHLVDMIPTILLHLAFHSSTPELTGFMPEVYTAQPKFRMDALDFSHVPPPQSDQKVLDVLCEEIFNNMCGAPEMAKVVETTWCLAMSDVSTIGVKVCKVGAGDGHTSSPRTSCSPGWCSWTQSWPPQHHSQSSRSSSSSSGSGSRSGSTSGSNISGSLRSGSCAGSCTESHTGS